MTWNVNNVARGMPAWITWAVEGLGWRLAHRVPGLWPSWSRYWHGAQFRHTGDPYFAAAAGVPGGLTIDEAQMLYGFAFRAGGDVLEVGAYCGQLSLLLAAALRRREGQGRLWCCEPFHTAGLADEIADERAYSLAGFERLMEGQGLRDRVVLLPEQPAVVLPRLRGEFALVVIDARHPSVFTQREAAWLKELVQPSGYLVFRDRWASLPRVAAAAHNALGHDDRFERVACGVGRLLVYARRPVADLKLVA